MIHTNGMESLRAMLKRTYVGVYSHMGAKHPDEPQTGSQAGTTSDRWAPSFRWAYWCKFCWQAAPSR